MYTTDNDHAAEFQMHPGRHRLDEQQPCIGSWIHYGLGTLNENLPQFVFLGQYKDPRVQREFAADYLGPAARRRRAVARPEQPAALRHAAKDVARRGAANEFEFIRDLNRLAAVEYPDDDQLRARIRAYELAFRMQAAVPEVARPGRRAGRDAAALRHRPGDHAIYGRRLLAARRLAERGVRFVLVYLSDYGEWDSHTELKTSTPIVRPGR